MQDIVPALERTVEALITHGVTEFFVGGYGGFGRLAAGAVIRAKRSHPHITLELLLPYHPSERPIEPPNGFDGTFYPPRHGVRPAQTCNPKSQPLHGRAQRLYHRLYPPPR